MERAMRDENAFMANVSMPKKDASRPMLGSDDADKFDRSTTIVWNADESILATLLAASAVIPVRQRR